MLVDAVADRRESVLRLPSPTVTVAGDHDRGDWEAFIAGRPDAAGYHAWAWRDVFERTFGHACFYLIARETGRSGITGVLPLVEIRSWIFGRTMTSLPFVNYGGVVAESEPVARALLAFARELAGRRGSRPGEMRA